MKHFCIVVNRSKEGASRFADKIKEYILQKEGTCFIAPTAEGESEYTEAGCIPEETECVLVLGGDGTFLQAARDLSELDLPMVGINLGSLGFLTMTESSDAFDAVDLLFEDKFGIDYRMKLSVTVNGHESQDALNEVVVSRGGYSRLVGITVYVDDNLFVTYESDGIIVSTPTGSTGYNLSAGGPIVAPDVDAIIIKPICPHAFNARSFVISADSVVRIVLRSKRHKEQENAFVTTDGVEYTEIVTEDEVIVKKSSVRCKMCRLKDFSFIDMLNAKFN